MVQMRMGMDDGLNSQAEFLHGLHDEFQVTTRINDIATTTH